jgi:aminopeptidase-like protein
MSAMNLIRDLYLTDFAPVSPGADAAVKRFQEELPFKVIEVASGTERNGWLVPNSWAYTTATIKKNGKVIYDGRKHPLGVVGYSLPFSGTVDLATLREHLFFSGDMPSALVFHCTHFYRPLERDWGFVVPKSFYAKLKPGKYDVEIAVQETKGTMKILEYTLPGESHERVVFHGHNCHPGQANDDLSGCAAGIEIMKRLAAIPRRRYTYTLLISPELFGAFYWLDRLSQAEVRNLRYGVMLKSVGNEAELKLQLSYPGNTEIDLAARNALRKINPEFVEGKFRRVYGNDETLFEAPGYKVPTISLTRYPFRQYHTSEDTPKIISEKRLEETIQVGVDIADALERNCYLSANFTGLLALSNPKYNLYQPFWNPAEKKGPKRNASHEWHYLMIDMFRDFEKNISMLEIAERHGLPFAEVYDYLNKLRATGAIDFVDERAATEVNQPTRQHVQARVA